MRYNVVGGIPDEVSEILKRSGYGFLEREVLSSLMELVLDSKTGSIAFMSSQRLSKFEVIEAKIRWKVFHFLRNLFSSGIPKQEEEKQYKRFKIILETLKTHNRVMLTDTLDESSCLMFDSLLRNGRIITFHNQLTHQGFKSELKEDDIEILRRVRVKKNKKKYKHEIDKKDILQ